jgi:alkaline phosphatase
VSTAEITDATPAVLDSHMSLRGCQGPADMANCPTETKAAGGLGSIAEQTVDHRVDVVLGGGRDKQDHATNACGQIGETVAFDRAIGVALDYQRSHPDTLVVVTADHAHTSQIVGEDPTGTGLPTGYSTNLLAKDGQTLTLTYGTAGYGGPGAAPVAVPPSQQHTGAVVPIWGIGPGSLSIHGTRDHTELFRTLGG